MRFVAERDAHEGLLGAYRVPRLPPDVRAAAAAADPRTMAAAAVPCSLFEVDRTASNASD
jgi:hypothetical protein